MSVAESINVEMHNIACNRTNPPTSGRMNVIVEALSQAI